MSQVGREVDRATTQPRRPMFLRSPTPMEAGGREGGREGGVSERSFKRNGGKGGVNLPACFWSSLLPSLLMGPTTLATATLSPVRREIDLET